MMQSGPLSRLFTRKSLYLICPQDTAQALVLPTLSSHIFSTFSNSGGGRQDIDYLENCAKTTNQQSVQTSSPPLTPMARAVAAAVKNVMKPREGEDRYEYHPLQATAMPPQRSFQMRSNSRARGRREQRSSPPLGWANELPREEWGARRPPAQLCRARATQPWHRQVLLLWCVGRLWTCGSPAAAAAGSAQGNSAAGGWGCQRLRIVAQPRSRAYDVRERKQKRGY
jgi:hypothetical protein